MKMLVRTLVFLIVVISFGVWFWLYRVGHSYDQPYTQVEEGLFIGSAVREPPPGTKAVVNLCGRKDAYESEASLWTPILEGGDEPDVDWLSQVVEFIAVQRKAGRPTYVHCLAGMNRSGAVVSAYLMYEHGWSRAEALKFLQSKREIVAPNPTLMRLLSDWEVALKDKRARS